MKYIFLVVLIVLNLHSYDSTIEIVKKIGKKPKIVLSDGNAGTTFSEKQRLLKLIIGDMKVTTNFDVDESLQQIAYSELNNFNTSSSLILNCKIEKVGSALQANVKLVNVLSKKSIYEKNYNISNSSRFAFLAHAIVVDLNNYFGAPSVDWMKRYIVFSKYTTSGNSEIVIADYTLTFQKTVVRGGLNIFPKWANSAQSAFYYTSYASGTPTLYKMDVQSGSRSQIASSSGMIVCSDVSDDGSKLLLTMAPDDQPDIYLYDVNSGSKKRVTFYNGVDVGGSFVDNGAKIVFISERLGYPNVYSKNINGRKVEQMIYHGKNNSSCTSHGKYIVYSSRETHNSFGHNVFNLYLISTQTDSIRKLTNSGKNMYPRFGNDGESISFIKYKGNQSSIGILRLNANRSFLFPLHTGKIQSIDW